MNIISQGKIFLSNQRGITENDLIKRHSTFNFDSFFNPAKEPIGELYALHDDVLAPNASINLYTREKGFVLIVPLTGHINYFRENGNKTEIHIGNAMIAFLEKNSFIRLQNPYEEELINYLMIGIKTDQVRANEEEILSIDISNLNQLHTITATTIPFKVSFGRFSGSGESEYPINPLNTLYAFVLAGGFEMDGRLLQERDGIALWGTKSIAMEALSNNAMLLLIELPQIAG
jgi:quercetin 2,3-dioxygenase